MTKRWFYLVTIVMMLLGIGGIVCPVVLPQFFQHPLFWEVARHLSEAVFIAGFMAIAVDRYVRERIIREIQKDTSKFLIGFQLPKEMRDRIAVLTRQTVICANYKLHLVGTLLEDGKTLKIEGTILYNVINLTDHKEPYHQGIAFEKDDNAEIYNIQCNTKDGTLYSKDSKDVSVDSHGVISLTGPCICIEPNSEGKDGPIYWVSSRTSTKFPCEYQDILSFGTPTVNVEVTADFPPTLEFIPHPGGTKISDNTWRYERLYMKDEHMRFRWRKRPT